MPMVSDPAAVSLLAGWRPQVVAVASLPLAVSALVRDRGGGDVENVACACGVRCGACRFGRRAGCVGGPGCIRWRPVMSDAARGHVGGCGVSRARGIGCGPCRVETHGRGVAARRRVACVRVVAARVAAVSAAVAVSAGTRAAATVSLTASDPAAESATVRVKSSAVVTESVPPALSAGLAL